MSSIKDLKALTSYSNMESLIVQISNSSLTQYPDLQKICSDAIQLSQMMEQEFLGVLEDIDSMTLMINNLNSQNSM